MRASITLARAISTVFGLEADVSPTVNDIVSRSAGRKTHMEWTDDALDRDGVKRAIEWASLRPAILQFLNDRELARIAASHRKLAKQWIRLRAAVEALPAMPESTRPTEEQRDRFLNQVGIDWVVWDTSNEKNRDRLLAQAEERLGRHRYRQVAEECGVLSDETETDELHAALELERQFSTRAARRALARVLECIRKLGRTVTRFVPRGPESHRCAPQQGAT